MGLLRFRLDIGGELFRAKEFSADARMKGDSVRVIRTAASISHRTESGDRIVIRRNLSLGVKGRSGEQVSLWSSPACIYVRTKIGYARKNKNPIASTRNRLQEEKSIISFLHRARGRLPAVAGYVGGGEHFVELVLFYGISDEDGLNGALFSADLIAALASLGSGLRIETDSVDDHVAMLKRQLA